MTTYQRMYDKESIRKFYLSPYVEYRLDGAGICFRLLKSEETVRLNGKGGEQLAEALLQGVSYQELLLALRPFGGEKEPAERLLAVLVRNKIIE